MVALLEACEVTNNGRHRGCHLGFLQELEITCFKFFSILVTPSPPSGMCIFRHKSYSCSLKKISLVKLKRINVLSFYKKSSYRALG